MRTLLAVLILAGLATACAPVEVRRSEGVNWILYQEQERQRLDDAGFPQFSGAV